jgi:hypothetical protein
VTAIHTTNAMVARYAMQRWAITKRIEAGEDLKPARTEVISIHSREENSGPPNIADMAMRDRYEAVEMLTA